MGGGEGTSCCRPGEGGLARLCWWWMGGRNQEGERDVDMRMREEMGGEGNGPVGL